MVIGRKLVAERLPERLTVLATVVINEEDVEASEEGRDIKKFFL
jgi:hypothetical protein